MYWNRRSHGFEEVILLLGVVVLVSGCGKTVTIEDSDGDVSIKYSCDSFEPKVETSEEITALMDEFLSLSKFMNEKGHISSLQSVGQANTIRQRERILVEYKCAHEEEIEQFKSKRRTEKESKGNVSGDENEESGTQVEIDLGGSGDGDSDEPSVELDLGDKSDGEKSDRKIKTWKEAALRSNPKRNGDNIIKFISKGEWLYDARRVDDYYKVDHDGQTGYVHENLIQPDHRF